MRKSVAETIKNVKVNPYYDLDIRALDELEKVFAKGRCDCVYEAFKYGYVMGHRATKKGVYEESHKG